MQIYLKQHILVGKFFLFFLFGNAGNSEFQLDSIHYDLSCWMTYEQNNNAVKLLVSWNKYMKGVTHSPYLEQQFNPAQPPRT